MPVSRKSSPVECQTVQTLIKLRASTPYHGDTEETPRHASNQGSYTPGYGFQGYRTPVSTNIRGWSSTPPHHGGSYTPSFGRGGETPARVSTYHPGQSGDTNIIRTRETEGHGDETPAALHDDANNDKDDGDGDGDSVMG